MPITSTDAEANANGIDARVVVRDGVIELRALFLKVPTPDFTLVALLSHVIWWLAEDGEGNVSA